MSDWLDLDFDPVTRKLYEEEKNLALNGKRVEFGTAGLRAPMGAGYDKMNALVVLQTTQGVCDYLMQELVDAKSRGVVIGYDGRHNSKKFAHVAASVFLARSFKVYLFKTETPTPLTPCLVSKLKTACGIQITASHNPKQDNGYKLYGHLGSQIVSPVDQQITQSILKNLQPWKDALAYLALPELLLRPASELLTVDPSATQWYMETIKSDLKSVLDPLVPSLKFVYTAMHGVGWETFEKTWKFFGYNPAQLIPLECQKLPDPEFPTVKFPNPEEKGALDLALQFAKDIDADYVLANDPDADRFTAIEKVARQDKFMWRQFTGDELGVLFADWRISSYSQSSASLSPGLVLTSVVSSRMLKKLADQRGIKYSDTLTGFKWIATQSIILRQANPELTHLCAYEEAIGYQLCGSVPDKDGISAGMIFAEMASYYKTLGISVFDRLSQLRQELGIFVTNNGYFISKDPKITEQIFDDFRTGDKSHIGSFKISSYSDITKGVNTELPLTPDAQMIQLIFECGATCTLRASGTEPKIKFYTEICCEDEISGKTVLASLVEELTRHFFNKKFLLVRG
jgi:phosphomannomutase